jgi:carboxymethylenebutenolidase
MAEFVTLTASDGHKFQAWWAPPQGQPRAGLVVIQEIFGVNSHIRDVTERFAKEGYLAVAPAMFDRIQRGVDIGYTEPDIAKGRELMGKLDWDKAILDIDAARASVSSLGSIGITGFCFGGSAAWVAAARLKFNAAVCYYGGAVVRFKNEKPACPTICHWGKQDANIPMSMVDEIKAAQPQVPMFLYDAGHGFSCDQRGSFNQAAHDEAWKRTLAHFAKFL